MNYSRAGGGKRDGGGGEGVGAFDTGLSECRLVGAAHVGYGAAAEAAVEDEYPVGGGAVAKHLPEEVEV